MIGIEENPINTEAGRKITQDALKKYNSYGDEWVKAYFDELSGGYNIYHQRHNFAKKGGGGDAEKIVGKMLAKYNGKRVEFLPEGNKKSPDISFDNQTWDIKYIDNASIQTIRNYIKEARKADNAIFYFTKERLIDLNNAVNREVGNFAKQNKIYQLPNIYYIDKDKIITLIWKK